MGSHCIYTCGLLFLLPTALFSDVLAKQTSIAPQSHLIHQLPHQPKVSFRQYAGYITVDKQTGRAFFYYFVETSQGHPLNKPLTLWLNGGPGCSSLGLGAFSEIGPFRPQGDVLIVNNHTWSKETNLLFLESPVGVGFSYSNTSEDYRNQTDATTARDNFAFLLNWFEKFPEYKGRDFYITGESYAGHYIPNLASLIVNYTKTHGTSIINLKALAIGNPALDFVEDNNGETLFWWNRGLINDENKEAVNNNCDWSTFLEDYVNNSIPALCSSALTQTAAQIGSFINQYDVLLDVCLPEYINQELTLQEAKDKLKGMPIHGSLGVDVCINNETTAYLNRADVQMALHANTTGLNYSWSMCPKSDAAAFKLYDINQLLNKMIPVIRDLLSEGLPILIYSGDQDTRFPITSTRTLIDQLSKNLGWRTTLNYTAWYTNQQVAGWTQAYGPQGTKLTFATVRGAGHMVPPTQPARALTLFTAFLTGGALPTTAPPHNPVP